MSLGTITKIIADVSGCDPEAVTPDAKLETLGIDSLKAITVLFRIEESFDIEIPNEVILSIVTVKDIMDRLENYNKTQ